jgi:hypothetical protein
LLALIQAIGAVAGWASAVGLAALSAVYVSHAREVKRLREWAGRAPERGVTVVPRRVGRSVAVSVAGLLVLGGATYGVTRSTGHDDVHRTPKRHVTALKPGTVTVAVLNGTMVAGLAARLSEEIAAAGYRQGAIDDYSDKQLAASVVQYAPGHQAEAKAVGRTLGISRREPVTESGRALAEHATVIVIAGADKTP